MISRRTFLIGINSLALVPCAFAGKDTSPHGLSVNSSSNTLLSAESAGLARQESDTLFKIYGWNATHIDETDPNTTVIHLSSAWRSGWL